MSKPTALVIDDEPMVRHLVRRILEPDVCGVVEVEDGEAALELLGRRRQAIDVVLTDLSMPGIDGFDVVEVLTLHHPDLPVACMSGYVSPPNASRRLAVPFLKKPFTTDALLAVVVPLIEQSRALRVVAQQVNREAAAERAASQELLKQSEIRLARGVDLIAAAHALRRARANGPGQS